MAYVRPVSKTTWYLGNTDYMIHMANELTSFFVGFYALILLWCIGAVAGGPEAYQSFLDSIASPGMLALLWVTTIVIFYHAVAWFSVTPKAMPVQRGEEFLPGSLIAGAHFVAWAVLTLVVLFLAGVFWMAKVNKAFFWSLFAAGGTLTAFLFPVLALLTLMAAHGSAPPIMAFDQMQGLLGHWFVKLVAFGTVSLALWHAGHRVRVALHELGLRADGAVSVVGYGIALIGTLLAAYYLLQI